MKKKVILTCTIVLTLWLAVLCVAMIKTASTDIIGGADGPTFQWRLAECIRSPFGVAVLIITIAAIVFIAVLVIKNYINRKNSN